MTAENNHYDKTTDDAVSSLRVDMAAEDASPAAPICVGLYCWECKKVRLPSGAPIDGPESLGRCGVAYGEGFHSHLVVSKVYVLPEPSA